MTMPFKSLHQSVADSLVCLNNARQEMPHAPKNDDVFGTWIGCAKRKLDLDATLKATSSMLKRRDEHLSKTKASIATGQGTEAILFLKAYHILSWSIYDRIYDVYSRMTGAQHVIENQQAKANVKLEEFFKAKGHGSSLGCSSGRGTLCREGFRWAYLVSYKIRNIVVHDGGSFENRDLFEYDQARNAIILTQTPSELLKDPTQEERVEEAKERSRRKGDSGFDSYENNALDVIANYNDDIDSAIGALLEMAVRDFESQVKYVCGLTTSNATVEAGR